MTFKYSILLLILSANFLFGQDFNFKGKISDSNNAEPIPNAVVFISYNYISYSNREGYFEINNVPAGNYTVKISRLGYKPILVEIIINENSVEYNFMLETSPIETGEVIVNSGRTEKFLRNSPYSELLIGKDQIESKQFNSVSDVLKTESGISLLRDGIWGTEISIRGLNRENIVTLIDGNRIATSTDIAARLSLINTGDIDRIEIIKGASSSIYGSGATGGILNIITKTPMLNNSFSINGIISSGFNSVNNMSALNGTIFSGDKSWSAKISGSYRNAGNTQTPAGELKNSQFEDYSFSGSLNIRPVDNHVLKTDYQLFKANDVGIPGASVFPNNADVRYPDEKRELFSAGYEIQNISKLFYKFSVKYAYQFIERNVENIPHTVQNLPASGTTPARRVSVLKITPRADHKNNNIQLHGNFLLSENNNLVAGIDYWDRSYNGSREKYQMIEVLNPQGNVVNTTNKIIGESPLPVSKFKSFGLFAQNDAELIKNKFTVTIGARYDIINVAGEKTFNPVYEITNGVYNSNPPSQKVIWNKIEADDASYSTNIGLKYSLNTNVDLTLGMGLSFRSPSLEERFQYIDQGSFVRIGNPGLNPEKCKSADLGIRYYSSDIKIISSFFFNSFVDLVAEIPGTFDGRNAFIKTNIGESRIYGFDMRADYDFYKSNIFYATVSFVKGDDITSSGHLPEIPPLNCIVGFKFLPLGKLTFDLSSSIFAEQNKTAAGELSTPGYAIFNLTMDTGKIPFYAFNFRIFAGVENIFDKEYRNHLSTTRGLIVVEPGRNFFLKLIADF